MHTKLNRTKSDQLPNASVAFLVTPAIPAILVVCFFVLKSSQGTTRIDIGTYTGLFFVAYLFAVAHELVLGLPAYFLGWRWHAIRWWTCLTIGFMIGYIPITILMQAPWTGFITWGVLGGVGGLMFWLLLRFSIDTNSQVKA